MTGLTKYTCTLYVGVSGAEVLPLTVHDYDENGKCTICGQSNTSDGDTGSEGEGSTCKHWRYCGSTL